MHSTSDVIRPPHSHRLRVRSLLLLVVLVPTLGMFGLATTSAASAADKRDVASDLQVEVDELSEIVDARIAVAAEERVSAVITVGSDLGVDVQMLSDLYDTDFAGQLTAARADVDGDRNLAAIPGLGDELSRLPALRDGVDAGTATFNEVAGVFHDLTAEIDDAWRAQSAIVDDDLGSTELAGTVHERARALRSTFEALSWGSRRATLAIRLVQDGPDTAVLRRLIAATSRHRAATERFHGILGPSAAAVVTAHQADPGTQRFERTLGSVVDDLLAGGVSRLADDPAAFGDAFIDGAPWGARLSDVVRGAGTDLQNEAARQERRAARALAIRIGAATVVTVLAVTGALLLARSVTRPIRRLEGAAHQIHDGRFDLDPIETSGPRELSDTARAFNDMASTLASVEAHAVALADDPDAPFLDHQLPGRTGRALQVALNRLRASIRGAEEHRRALEIAATHDGLTGLLNRTAALTMIERDLSRAGRVEGSVMALFIDLDGFKGINDEHGHAAGDDALRLTAEALRATTRSSDVVARLGGDEFLVAGVVIEDRDEVESLAQRIREAIASVSLASSAGRIPLRCSIGMAMSGPETTTVESLIQRADAALYLAKRRGRDRAVWDERPDTRDASTGATTPP